MRGLVEAELYLPAKRSKTRLELQQARGREEFLMKARALKPRQKETFMRERVTLQSIDPLPMANLYALFGLATGAFMGLFYGGMLGALFASGSEGSPLGGLLALAMSVVLGAVGYGAFCWIGTLISMVFLNLGLRIVGGVKLRVDMP